MANAIKFSEDTHNYVAGLGETFGVSPIDIDDNYLTQILQSIPENETATHSATGNTDELVKNYALSYFEMLSKTSGAGTANNAGTGKYSAETLDIARATAATLGVDPTIIDNAYLDRIRQSIPRGSEHNYSKTGDINELVQGYAKTHFVNVADLSGDDVQPNQTGGTGQKKSRPDPRDTQSKTSGAKPLSDEEILNAEKVLGKISEKERAKYTDNAEVVEAIFAQPAPVTFIPEGQKIRLTKVEEKKIHNYENKLVESEENRNNFNKLVAAMKNGTEVEALRGTSTSLIGFKIREPGESIEGEKITSIVSREIFMSRLAKLGLCAIKFSEATGLGAKIKTIKPSEKAIKERTVDPSKAVKRKTFRLHVMGLSDARKEERACIVYAREKSNETAPKRLRSNLSFQIVETKENRDTHEPEQRIRTVRFNGLYDDCPVFVPKEKYATVLPTGSDSYALPDAATVLADAAEFIMSLKQDEKNLDKYKIRDIFADIDAMKTAAAF